VDSSPLVWGAGSGWGHHGWLSEGHFAMQDLLSPREFLFFFLSFLDLILSLQLKGEYKVVKTLHGLSALDGTKVTKWSLPNGSMAAYARSIAHTSAY